MNIVDREQFARLAELAAVQARIAHPPFELPGANFEHDHVRIVFVRHAHFRFGPGVHLVDGDEQQRRGGQNRPDDFQRVAAVRELDRLGDCRSALYFHRNQNSTPSVTTNTTPVSQRMNMNRWSMPSPASEASGGSQMPAAAP